MASVVELPVVERLQHVDPKPLERREVGVQHVVPEDVGAGAADDRGVGAFDMRERWSEGGRDG